MAANPGRNDPCSCGSGKKFKQCCMQAAPGQPARPGPSIPLKQAIAQFEQGNLQAAIATCQRILQADPRHTETMTLLGVLAFYVGNAEAAIQILQRSLALDPKQPDAENNLGEIYRATGHFQQAFTHFQQALRLAPEHLGALINHGNALQDIYRYDDAIATYQRALAIDPRHTGALSNLANTYQQLYQHEAAIKTFTRLLTIDPAYEWALGGRMYSRIHCCDWQDHDAQVAEITARVAMGERPIKVFELRPISDDPALELKCARMFAEAMYPAAQQAAPLLPIDGKVRIAYLSADFRAHPVSQLLVEVLERHDRSRFEIIGISFGPDDSSDIRARVSRAFDRFIDVRQQSDAQVAGLLRSEGVHIAMDLMGYTTHARPGIFAQRAVPLQVAYLGYAGTTGSPAIDCVVADEVIIPASHETWYSERVLRLPTPLLPRDNTLQLPVDVPDRAAAGLPAKGFVFCAFNNHYKISPPVFDIWMRLLGKVEGSVLWLSDTSVIVKDNLRKEALSRGIDGDRIIFAKRTERLEDHIARHALADLFLDAHPYNAHTTASDALWAGLPVVTYCGQIFAARVAASLLTALKLPELITDSLDAYEALALQLSTDAGALAQVRSRLIEHKAALEVFDAERYARNLEQTLLGALAHKRQSLV
jgi:protein O-GlcNAc transferase